MGRTSLPFVRLYDSTRIYTNTLYTYAHNTSVNLHAHTHARTRAHSHTDILTYAHAASAEQYSNVLHHIIVGYQLLFINMK